MNVNKQAVLVFCIFAIALASGIILGNGLSRKVASPEAQQQVERDPRKRLAMELGLSADQQEKQTAIYEQAWAEGQKIDEHRRQIDRERDEVLTKFLESLPAQERAAYEKIQSDHRKQRDQIGKEMEDVFNKRRDALKRILSDEQLVKYEEILKNRPPGGRRWGGPGRDGGPRGSRGMPATAESRPAEPAK